MISTSIIALVMLLSSLEATDVYKDFYAVISRNNGKSNSFLVNSIWKGYWRMKHSMGRSVSNSPDQCLEDIEIFIESFYKEEIWALKMLDASSNLQSGFLEGNIINLGDFKECLTIHELRYNIKGQYCTVNFYTPSSDTAPFVTRHYNVQNALCLPSSCSVKNLTDLLKDGLEGLDQKIYFSVDDCETQESLKPKINFLEIIILCFFVVLGSTLLVATLFDILIYSEPIKSDLVKKRRSNKKFIELKSSEEILLSFSLKSNLKRLLEEDNRDDSIRCLHGLRFISACMVLSIHRIITDPQPLTNLFMLDDEIRKWTRLIQMNAYLFVDIFFLISGLLISYNSSKSKKINTLEFLLHRYLRLTPPLVICLFLTILLDMLCDGPYCNGINRLAKEQCLNNSVYTLMYINNFINSSESCLPHTWYLSADIQLFCISSLLVIFQRKWPQSTYKLILAYWTLSIGTTFLISYAHQIQAGFIGSIDSFEIDSSLLYEQFYTRAGPWAVGFALGIWLRDSKRKKYTPTKVTKAIGWILATLLIFLSYFGIFPFVQRNYKHGRLTDSLYNTFSRNMFAVGVGWIIYSCHCGYGGFLNDFLSSTCFQLLSKITYCFYLVHPLAQAMQYSQVVVPRTYTDLSQMYLILGDLFFTTIFASLLHLAVEGPALNLLTVFCRRVKTSIMPLKKSIDLKEFVARKP